MTKTLISIALGLGLSVDAMAGDGQIGPLTLGGLAFIAAPLGSHHAGNVEITLPGSFAPPAGVNCPDQFHLTTSKANDADRSLFRILQEAREHPVNAQVVLFITDDVKLQAFPDRCSLKGVELIVTPIIT